jgi:hypothetical protein
MSERGLAVLIGALAALVVVGELFGAALGDMMPSDVASDYDPDVSLDEFSPDGFNSFGRTGMNDSDAEDGDGFTGL